MKPRVCLNPIVKEINSLRGRLENDEFIEILIGSNGASVAIVSIPKGQSVERKYKYFNRSDDLINLAVSLNDLDNETADGLK